MKVHRIIVNYKDGTHAIYVKVKNKKDLYKLKESSIKIENSLKNEIKGMELFLKD